MSYTEEDYRHDSDVQTDAADLCCQAAYLYEQAVELLHRAADQAKKVRDPKLAELIREACIWGVEDAERAECQIMNYILPESEEW